MIASPPGRQLVDDYAEWIRSRMSARRINGACEITAPFLDRHNDYIQFYAEPTGDGFRLTDDAQIIRDLELSGCDLSTPRRKELLTMILNGLGVRRCGDELTVDAAPDNLPASAHALIQAMLAVNDMFATAQPLVASLFHEDVERYLKTHKVRFTPQAQFVGKSRLTHNFDFIIPASEAAPERIVRAINQPDRNNITAMLFAWNDTKETRPAESRAYAILNDQKKKPTAGVRNALRQYNIEAVPWKNREQYAQLLAA